jgi:hypothetical protein
MPKLNKTKGSDNYGERKKKVTKIASKGKATE